ncbi:MAG TPA: CHAT domain-containing protein, partial [Anaerolineae bacterium]|nr:CHAT domain-containing protein [Anaerolineae bacterium]
AAISRYEEAVRYLDEQFLISPVSFQLGQQRSWAGLFTRTVAAYLQADNSQSALALAEGSKSRLLTTLLGRGRLPAPPSLPSAQVAQERELAEQLNVLDATALSQRGQPASTAPEGNITLAQRQALVRKLRQIWQEMAQHGPEAQDYIALRRGDRPTWDDLSRLALSLPPDTAILSLFTTGDQILLFLLRPDGSMLPATADLSLADFRYLYRNNYVDEVLNRSLYRHTGRPLTHRWRGLGQPLLAPILPHLDGIRHLVIVPEGPLHLLPLHALTLDDDGRTLLDDFTISYIPALALLDRLRRRPPVTDGQAAVFGHTDADENTPEGAWEKKIFLGEAKVVAKQLHVSPILDTAASGQALRDRVANRTLRLLHLSCHGYFAGNDPLHSGILLADGVFTARDFMRLRFQADLVTLSACQTGISGSLGGDEMAGLSQALLYAGASSLLMGLWSVNAFTTASLMSDMYRRLWGPDGGKQMSEAQALREASLSLRRGELIEPNPKEGFDPADPYYWAPFVLAGDWR